MPHNRFATFSDDFSTSTWQVAGPAIYRTYLAAARRLDLSNESSGYWELHITEDERHGRQMVEDVALPLVDRCARVLGVAFSDASAVLPPCLTLA